MSATRHDAVHEAVPVASVEHDLIRAHALAALAGVIVAACFGWIAATKFAWPSFAGGVAPLTWGRMRYDHTQGIFFGWFGNAFLAFLYYVVPRLSDKPVRSRRLGWLLFGAWNLGVLLPGWTLVSMGTSQSLEWAEFPVAVDIVALLGLVLAVVQFVTPFARSRASDLYISGWYIIGALVFTALAYPVGNFVPEFVPGGMGAAFSGLWTHDAVGLFVTPLALSIAYFVIPAVTRRPIYSHFVSLIGFWLLLLIYPLNGMHHYLWSPLPMSAQRGAVVASVVLGVTVVVVVTNLFLSLRGATKRIASDIALRFVWTGIVCYLLVSLQGATQALMPFNRVVHFTDWVVGHAHLAMLGFASFCAVGALLHAWEHTPRVRYKPLAARWGYWLLLTGLVAMVLDLSVAGVVQGEAWASGLPWITSVQLSRIYWIGRVAAGTVVIAGLASIALALTTGHLRVRDAAPLAIAKVQEDFEVPPLPENHAGVHRRLGMLFATIFAASVVFFGLSFVALGVLPAREVLGAMREAPPGVATLTASEARGRAIYMREGCAYCHTQQVRMIAEDIERFGPPSESWEQAHDIPHLWGTRRIGPDLAREARVRRNDWQLTHLYDPRRVEPTSIMPGFPWLFEGSAARPTQDALDVVAYLQSLGRPMREGQGPASSMAASQPMKRNCACSAIDRATPLFPVSSSTAVAKRGEQVFSQRCTGCHGARGRGDGPAAPTLVPHPADLTAATFRAGRLSSVLWNGVPGTAMPSFRDLQTADLRGLVAFVDSLGPKPSPKDSSPALDRGRAVFDARCSNCHGVDGDGDGPSEMRLPRLPADFTSKQPTDERIHRVLDTGIPGTGMQAMAQNMTPAQIDDVATYVRSLYFTGAPREEVQ
jgi:cytochrome c oxidase cbb3-type subunit I/II